MMRSHRIVVSSLLFLLALSWTPARAADSLSPSGREFVQGFYDWYVPMALQSRNGPAWQSAVDRRSADFDPKLLTALEVDLAAATQPSDVIDSLDFDPFLNSQDPAGRYEVGSARSNGAALLVDVYGLTSGKHPASPDVIAEIEQRSSHWQFVDFRYPGHGNLSDILSELRTDRAKH